MPTPPPAPLPGDPCVVDPDGLFDQTVFDQAPLDPAIATIEDEGALEHPTGHLGEMLEPLPVGMAGDPFVDAPAHHVEVVPVGLGVIDVAVVVDVERFSHPALSLGLRWSPRRAAT